MKRLKSLVHSLLPRELLFLRRLVRDGKVAAYCRGIGRFKRDKTLVPADFKAYLSVTAIVKNETPYIAEWIEYHLLAGVQRFYIYDNESTDNLREFLDPYIREGVVEYLLFPGKRRQVAAYNDAIRRYKYASFWLAFIDIDEFLVPVSAASIPELLRDFEDVPGIEINQVLYGSGGRRHKESGLVMERFKDHSLYSLYSNKGVKSIVNPRYVAYMPTAHIAEYFGSGTYSVDTHKHKNLRSSLERPALHDRIRINHYGTKSLEEFASRIELGRASSPGTLSLDVFYERDHNEIKNDTIMDAYIPTVKLALRQRNNE
jgi:hypothetical protein